MNFQQKPSPVWWIGNIRYFVYFLRELTGVIIAFYMIYFLLCALADPTLAFTAGNTFATISWISFGAAVFHSITWLGVAVKISPVKLNKPLQALAFLALIGAWGGVSYFLLNYLYA